MVGKHLNITVFISWAAKMELEMSLYSKISASDSLCSRREEKGFQCKNTAAWETGECDLQERLIKL